MAEFEGGVVFIVTARAAADDDDDVEISASGDRLGITVWGLSILDMGNNLGFSRGMSFSITDETVAVAIAGVGAGVSSLV